MQVVDYESKSGEDTSGKALRDAFNAILAAVKTQNSGNEEPLNPTVYVVA